MSSAHTPGLMSIGEEAKPPFAILPVVTRVFLTRAKRLEQLSTNHTLAGYLSLVAKICHAQATIVASLPVLEVTVETAGHPSMPRLQFDQVAIDDVAVATLTRLAEELDRVDAPVEFKAVLNMILTATPLVRRALLEAALKSPDPDGGPDDVAVRAIALAALQVHFTRLATLLPVDQIEAVAHGVCPVCASAPTASAVVSLPTANNTRFCTCSLCSTQWHVVRVKCVTCGSTGGLSYPHIEGHSDGLRAETCDSCKSYVKIVYQTKDPALEPFADDIASLDLDMMLRDEGWTRGGRNPFLLGY
jgi:FdhE protein